MIRVRGIGFFHIEILLIHAKDRETPRESLIVSDADAGKAGFSRAQRIPAWSVQVHHISEGWVYDLPVRIIGDDRHSCRGFGSTNNPVVAAEVRFKARADVVGSASEVENLGLDIIQVKACRYL